MQISVKKTISNADLPLIDEAKIPVQDASKIVSGNLNVESVWHDYLDVGSEPFFGYRRIGFNSVLGFLSPVAGPISRDFVFSTSPIDVTISDEIVGQVIDNAALTDAQKAVTFKAWISGANTITLRMTNPSSQVVSTVPVKITFIILKFVT